MANTWPGNNDHRDGGYRWWSKSNAWTASDHDREQPGDWPALYPAQGKRASIPGRSFV